MRGLLKRQLHALGVAALLACQSSERARGEVAETTPAVTPGSTGGAPAVTARGFGPIVAGMTIAEARAAVPSLRPMKVSESACEYATADVLPRGVTLLVESGVIGRVDVDSSSVPTAEGARVGDSEDAVRKLYGSRVSVTPHKYTNGHYLTVTPMAPSDSQYRIIFETDGKRVTRYRAGRLPQVAYVEGCS